MSDENLRKSRRAPLSLLVQVRGDAMDSVVTEYTADVSSTGLFIRTDDPKPVGSFLHVQVMPKDGSRLIEGMGRVVRVIPPGVDRPGMGIQFLDLEPEEQKYLASLCEVP
jgi:uncharacterized protein (TIGR02266 family)